MLALILLAFNVTCYFVVFRWTRTSSTWARRLILSGLLAMLCPPFVVQTDAAPFIPTILFLVLEWAGLKSEEIRALFIQSLSVWGATYFLWSAFAVICGPHSETPDKTRRVKLVATICSLPSWVLMVDLVLYRVWIDGKYWPHPDLLAAPLLICALCSMAAMTMFLISMDGYSIPRTDILVFLWSAFPVLFGLFLVCLFWLFAIFGTGGTECYYGMGDF